MPIRPENRALYPANWKALSKRIRHERAGNRCECRGECGDPFCRHGKGRAIRDADKKLVRVETDGRCNAPNGKHVQRQELERALWRLAKVDTVAGDGWLKAVRIVLTVAHLDHDPTSNADENLLALCQRCHNKLDAPHRAETRARTRAGKDASPGGLARPPKCNTSTSRPVTIRGDGDQGGPRECNTSTSRPVTNPKSLSIVDKITKLEGLNSYFARAQRAAGGLMMVGAAKNTSDAGGMLSDWLDRHAPEGNRKMSTASMEWLARAWAAKAFRKEQALLELDARIKQQLADATKAAARLRLELDELDRKTKQASARHAAQLTRVDLARKEE